MTAAETLARRVRTVHYDALPDAVIEAAKYAVEDTIAVALAGASGANTETALAAIDGAPGPATVWGRGSTASALDAAFVNAVSAHALDFDDCTTTIGGHPSAPLVPPIIALGEALDTGGQAIIEAYVAGYETLSRLGRAVMPEHYEIGWHPTATLGVFGAAAAASKLLGLGEEETAAALAIAPSLAAGTKKGFGTQLKSLQVGMAARNGLLAARLAAAGCDAPADAIEGGLGFFALFNDGAGRASALAGEPGTGWALLDPGIQVKQHPCCGSAHGAIDAAIALHAAHGPMPLGSIDRVIVSAHPRRLGHTDNPAPRTGLEAKFSMQFLVALALARGRIRLADFEEPFDGGLYRPFAAKLELVAADMADEFEATVEVRSGSTTRSAACSTPLGRGGERPMTAGERDAKFADCTVAALPQERAAALLQSLRRLERLAHVSELTALLT